MLFYLNNWIGSQLLNKKKQFLKKNVRKHFRPDVAVGKVSPGRGILATIIFT